MNDTDIHEVAERIKELGAVSLAIEYSGGGDSGFMDNFKVIRFHPTYFLNEVANAAEGFDALDHLVAEEYYAGAVYPVSLFCELDPEQEDFFSRAADALFDRYADAISSGWWNNDGGRGTILLLAEPKVQVAISHFDYYTESNQTDETFEVK